MNARQKRVYDHRQALSNQGWDVPKRDFIAFNGTSETLSHLLGKASIAWVLKQEGYRVSTEVAMPQGEVDVLFYGTEDMPAIVEVQTGWTDEVLADKLERYTEGYHVRDMFPVEVNEMPDVEPLEAWAEEQI